MNNGPISADQATRYKVQLLVSEWCKPCHAAEAIWRQVAEQRDIDFEVLDMAQPEARSVAKRASLRTIPAIVINDKLVGVGVQTLEQAFAQVAGASAKTSISAKRFIGMTLEVSSRVALISAAIYLVLAGIPLGLAGGLYGGLVPLGALHLFTIGFVLFTIFALADHMLPRFSGSPIRLGTPVWTQHWFTHLGLWSMVFGYLAEYRSLVLAGGTCAGIGLAIFAVRLLPVLRTRSTSRPVGQPAATAGIVDRN